MEREAFNSAPLEGTGQQAAHREPIESDEGTLLTGLAVYYGLVTGALGALTARTAHVGEVETPLILGVFTAISALGAGLSWYEGRQERQHSRATDQAVTVFPSHSPR